MAHRKDYASTKRKKPRWEQAFLRAFARTAIHGHACKQAKVDQSTVHRYRHESPEFEALYQEARELAMDRLEQEAERRAVQGLLRKKFTSKGEPIIDPKTGKQYAERDYSDTLLIFLLKGGRPDKFRERVEQQHTGAGGGPLIVKVIGNTASMEDL